MLERIFGEKYLFKAIGRGDVPGVRRLLEKGVNPNARDSQGIFALACAARQTDAGLIKEFLRRGGLEGLKDALGTAITIANVPVVAALLESGGLKCWWEDYEGLPLRAIYERADRKAQLLDVVDDAKKKEAARQSPDLRKLWQDGPEDDSGSRVFRWLKDHRGECVWASRWFEQGNFTGAKWSISSCSERDTKAWVVGSPDIGPRRDAFAKSSFTLRWWLGDSSPYSSLELELPMDTYQEAEVAEDGLLYWIGKEIVTGEWKPSGDMGASAARTTRREDVGTRVFYSFRLRR